MQRTSGRRRLHRRRQRLPHDRQLHFGSDGSLYVGIGDGADAALADPLSLRAQDLNSPNGKILRIRTDGTAPPDNPFYDGTERVAVEGVAVRRAQPVRVHVQPGTERDLVRRRRAGTPGKRSTTGRGRRTSAGRASRATCPSAPIQRTTRSARSSQPSAVTRRTTRTTTRSGSAAIGGPFYNGTLYPQQYRDNFFFADYTGNFIRRVVFDGSSNPVSLQTFATNVPHPVVARPWVPTG